MSTLKTTNIAHASSASNNIVLASDGTTTIAAPSNIIKSGTAVASTSGTSIDFTEIPSWVKRITVMFNGVSTNGASNYLIQVGSAGSVETSGYASRSAELTTSPAVATTSATSGYVVRVVTASAGCHGHLILTQQTGNTWVSSHTISTLDSPGSVIAIGGGSKSLSAALDRVRITTVNGTDTFDAGTINILYEG